MTNPEVKVVAKECRFAIHIPEKPGVSPDLHLVKEQVHYSDGTIKPQLKWIQDYKRKVYVTKRHLRKYQQKREWAQLDEVDVRECTQSMASLTAAKMLGMNYTKEPLKRLAVSPYLYGTDITSTSLIKKEYMKRYPEYNTPFTLATFDVETDVVNGTEEVIMATVIFKKEVYIVVDSKFIKGIAYPDQHLQEKANKYIGEHLQKHEMVITLVVADGVVDVIRKSFARIHELKPDWLAIWNMDYDVPKMLANLEKYGEDPRDFFCDPSVPKSLRVCRYRQGPKKKTTASGRQIPINPAAQWHTFICTAGYYIIDAMCAYKHLRLGEQEESSYSLDAILALKLGIRKLKFKEADTYEGLRWHQFMQMNYKIEYMVYNIFDCLSMIELDEKTKDLAYTLPSFSATTDFDNFKSQPRRIADAMHFYALENNYVMGTVAPSEKPADPTVDTESPAEEDQEEKPEEDKVLDRKGWVLTLPPLNAVLGLQLIEEDPTIRTGIRGFTFDSDATSAYPSATSVGNVSKTTTVRELISIEGLDEFTFRMNNLNLVLGPVNAIEYSVQMFNLPTPDKLLEQLTF